MRCCCESILTFWALTVSDGWHTSVLFFSPGAITPGKKSISPGKGLFPGNLARPRRVNIFTRQRIFLPGDPKNYLPGKCVSHLSKYFRRVARWKKKLYFHDWFISILVSEIQRKLMINFVYIIQWVFFLWIMMYKVQRSNAVNKKTRLNFAEKGRGGPTFNTNTVNLNQLGRLENANITLILHTRQRKSLKSFAAKLSSGFIFTISHDIICAAI